MLFLSIAQDYFLWHYTRAFGEFFRVWMNLLWFTIHFFSLPQLLKTWFAPYKRITEERKKGASFEDWFGSILVNLLSRLVGAILRTVIIIVGLCSLLLVICFGAATYILWLAFPVVTVALIIVGGTLLIV